MKEKKETKKEKLQRTKKEKNNNESKQLKKKQIVFGIIAVILIAIFCVSMTPVTLQNDTFYTIKIGEQITKTGIDMQEHFSWHPNLSYTYPHWLYDLLTYFIYNIFGMTGIYVTTCILSALLGISIYLVNKKLIKNQWLSFILSLVVIYVIRGYIAARAQLVTFILFIWLIYFIERFLKTRKIRYTVGIILIATLIANLHAAVWPFIFILFLPFIGEYIIAVLAETFIYRKYEKWYYKIKIALLSNKNITTKNKEEKLEQTKQKLNELEAIVDKIKIKRDKELENPYKIKLRKNKNVKWLILVMIITAFTGLLTPLGDTPYTYLYKTMQGNTTQNINEHLPMTLIDETEALSAIVIFIALLTFTKSKIRLSDLFMIGGLCYLMIASRRQITMFAIIGSVILNRLICNVMETYEKGGVDRVFNCISKKLGYVVMIVVVLGLSYHFAKPKFKDKYIDESSYPVQACDYILENIDLGTARFYNEYNYGSYMLFRGIPVFIDSRADLYAPEFSGQKDDIFSDFINVSSIATFYEDIFEKYDITHAIMYKNSKMNMIIEKTHDANYKKLYEDDYFVIYQRLNA